MCTVDAAISKKTIYSGNYKEKSVAAIFGDFDKNGRHSDSLRIAPLLQASSESSNKTEMMYMSSLPEAATR